jgi:hypothetical protein
LDPAKYRYGINVSTFSTGYSRDKISCVFVN